MFGISVIFGLPYHNHRARCFQETLTHVNGYSLEIRKTMYAFYGTLLRQRRNREVEQRLTNRHINMYRDILVAGCKQGLVNQSVAIPAGFVVMRFGQRHRFPYKTAEDTRLRECLPVQLVNPLQGTVGRNHHQRLVLIPSLSNCRNKIQQGCARRDTDRHRQASTLAHAQSIESCRTLIGYGMARDIGTLREIVHNG